MKKVIISMLSLIICLTSYNSYAELVLKQTVTVSFYDVNREGLYTGEVNTSGLPDGFGVFEATNSEHNRYIIVGNWENGKQIGESWQAIENGEQYIGTFENGELVKGKYVTDVKIAKYDRALDTGYGYTAESLFDMNWNKLDDKSIIQLLSNTFGCEPMDKGATGFIWLINGASKFCDLDIVAVWASVNDAGKIISISYMMRNSSYYDLLDDSKKDLDFMDTLITRLNARIGKTGDIILDEETLTNNIIDDR